MCFFGNKIVICCLRVRSVRWRVVSGYRSEWLAVGQSPLKAGYFQLSSVPSPAANTTDPSQTASVAQLTVPGPTDGKRLPGLWSVIAPLPVFATVRLNLLVCDGIIFRRNFLNRFAILRTASITSCYHLNMILVFLSGCTTVYSVPHIRTKRYC